MGISRRGGSWLLSRPQRMDRGRADRGIIHSCALGSGSPANQGEQGEPGFSCWGGRGRGAAVVLGRVGVDGRRHDRYLAHLGRRRRLPPAVPRELAWNGVVSPPATRATLLPYRRLCVQGPGQAFVPPFG